MSPVRAIDRPGEVAGGGARVRLAGAVLLPLVVACAPARPAPPDFPSSGAAASPSAEECERELRTMEATLHPTMNVAPVTRDELEAAVGADLAEAILSRVLIVRVYQEAERDKGPDLQMSLVILGPLERVEASATAREVSREAMARRTGEKLPEAREVEKVDKVDKVDKDPLTITIPLGGAIDTVHALVELLTLGMVRRDRPPPPEEPEMITISPTDADFQRAAPVAERLYQVLRPKSTRGSTLIFKRLPADQDIKLRLLLSYRGFVDESPCALRRRRDISLPHGDSLEARIVGPFGSRQLPLSGPEAPR